MRRTLLQTLAEVGVYLTVGYLALPGHERQRLRMSVLQLTGSVARTVAYRSGRLAIKMESTYAKEVASNG